LFASFIAISASSTFATEIVGIEDRLNIAKAVTCERCDLFGRGQAALLLTHEGHEKSAR
jgi:hypothetical protein